MWTEVLTLEKKSHGTNLLIMASGIEKQALNRLLLVISKELEKEKFEDLIRLYDVKPQDVKDLDQYGTLQYLYDKKVLDLRALAENLSAVGCHDQSKKVADYITSKEPQDKIEAVYPGEELVQAVPETGAAELHTKPIEEQDEQTSTTLVMSPSTASLRQASITDAYPQSRHGPPNKRLKTSISNESLSERDSTFTDGEDNEDDEPPPVATGKDLEYMTRALEVARKSGDPHTKVGAVVVSPEDKIIGEGYNYLPRDDLTWDRVADKEEDTKYPYVTHAAVEAITDAYEKKESPNGSTLYTNLYPSSRDGVSIIRAKIKEVVYLDEKKDWRKRYRTGATKRLFDGVISCRQVTMPEAQRVSSMN